MGNGFSKLINTLMKYTRALTKNVISETSNRKRTIMQVSKHPRTRNKNKKIKIVKLSNQNNLEILIHISIVRRRKMKGNKIYK